MPDHPRATLRGPARAKDRALAPDLARGFMLLLIVVANTPFYLFGRERAATSVHPADGSIADQIAQAVIITGVDMRVYPMFAFLFGYGMVQLMLRQEAAGTPRRAVLALLRRRNLWLIVFGLVHALLLWMGDILAAYGITGLILAILFLRRTNRTLLTWAGIGTGIVVALGALAVLGAVAAAASDTPAQSNPNPMGALTANVAETDPLAAAAGRLTTWLLLVFMQGLFSFVIPVAILLGFWAARQRVLEEPHRHLPLLRCVTVGGIAIGWLGGLPNGLHHVGVLAVPESASWVFSVTQLPTGLAGGLGYAALFGLISHWLGDRTRDGFVVTSITALGKRSMSGYLAQSVICAPVLAAWGLGLGATLSSAQMAGFAAATWVVTVAGAFLLERAGRRGPAEVLLRRLSYRQSTVAASGTLETTTR